LTYVNTEIYIDNIYNICIIIYSFTCLSSIMDVCVLYSGGFDSTHTAIHYLEKGNNVHLLTFDNGAISYIEQICGSVDRFRSIDKEAKVTHDITSIMHLLQTVVFDSLESDILWDKKNLICVWCKLCMTAAAIIYCIQNNIKILADWYRKTQACHPEQTPIFMSNIDEFAASYGIDYQHPIYDITDDRVLRLKWYKYSIASTSIKTHCVIHSVSNYDYKEETILKYINRKIPSLREYIQKEIERTSNKA